MLFHEPIFLFAFLPIFILLSYFILRTKKNKLIIVFLSCMSLIFYGYWNISFIPLLIGSKHYTDTSSQICTNGFLSETFTLERGVRRRCPPVTHVIHTCIRGSTERNQEEQGHQGVPEVLRIVNIKQKDMPTIQQYM